MNQKFYLSRDACIKLGILNSDYPRISITIESFPVHEDFKNFDSVTRTSHLKRTDELPFTRIPEN